MVKLYSEPVLRFDKGGIYILDVCCYCMDQLQYVWVLSVYRPIELSLDLSSNACYDLYAYIEAQIIIQEL